MKTSDRGKKSKEGQGMSVVSSSLNVVACIPTYLDEDRIAKVVVGAKKYADKVFVCDDASTDATYDIIESLGVESIRNNQTMGYKATLATLYRHALNSNADFILTIDAENNYDVNEMPLLVDRIIKGDVDIVIGSKYLNKSPDENETSFTISGVTFTDPNSNFKVFTRKVLESLTLEDDHVGTNLLVNAIQKGFKVAEVPIHVLNVVKPLEPPKKGGIGVLDKVREFSMKHPLLLFGVPGLLAVAASLGAWAMVISNILSTGILWTNMLILGVGSLSVGLLFVFTALLLWVFKGR